MPRGSIRALQRASGMALKLKGLVCLERPQVGCVSVLQPDGAIGAGTTFAGVPQMGASTIERFAQQGLGHAPTQDPVAIAEPPWRISFDETNQGWENRHDKKHPTGPDYRHATTGEGLWGNKRFKSEWVEAKLHPLQDAKADGDGVELQWQQHFEDPTEWWDNISSKSHMKSRDLGHKRTRETLGINGWSTPGWVAQVDGQPSSEKAGNSSLDYGSGCAGHCQDVVHLISAQQDEFSWTSKISQYTKSGQFRLALKAYEEMRQKGVEPSSFTFVAALKACSSLQDLESCKQIHVHVAESGSAPNLFVENMLVDVYAKCGSIIDARCVFDTMSHHDVVSWNSMILAYAQLQGGEEALQLYAQMQEEGVAPNDRTFVVALKACSSLAALEAVQEAANTFEKRLSFIKARAIHSDVLMGGFESDKFVATMLVDVYAKCGNLVEARRVFDKMPRRDVVAWNAMILGYAQMEEGEEALELYARMRQEGVVPNKRTVVGALKACSNLAAVEEGNQANNFLMKQCLERARALHSDIVKAGFETDAFVGTMLVDVYAKCGSLVDARRVFENVVHRDVISWNAMILGYAQMDEGNEALQLYARMRREGMLPNERTFVGVLKACSSLAALEEGNGAEGKLAKKQCLEQVKAIHSDLVKWHFESDLFVGNMLVDVYSKCGSLVDARQVFERMPHRTVVSWSAMISGYAQMEDGEEALQLYARMQQEGVDPNDCTFLGVLKGCASVGALQQGKEIHLRIQEQGLEADVVVGSSLVNLYTKCGSLAEARRVFDVLPSKNVVTWNALLYGYAKHSDGQLAMQCFEEMRQFGVEPDDATFTSLLVACSHAALVNEGQQYFRMMVEEHGIAPTVHHYCSMVDLLGRSGRLQEAEDLLHTMPFDNDVVGWTSLLTACRSHGDLELGSRCFDRLIALERDNAVPYVLLGNIYANAGRWSDVDKVESLRKSAGAWKKPGKACIEVKRKVHEFTVGEERSDVSSDLRSMNSRLKEGGHVPHTELVLKAVSEREKEDALCGHAEKLALAYGLLNTSDGTTLLVTKNLRMCDDCHSSTKVMSRLEKREIVVRDAHRVHRFVDGSCSCRDAH